MKTNHNLRALVQAQLGCDDARIDQLLRASARAAKRVGAVQDESDALVSIWHAACDPGYYSGRRGPQPRDQLLRAVEVAAERQRAMAIDWDASTPAAIEAADLLAEAIATSWERGRPRGTRPQAARRAAARRQRTAASGQGCFGGFGWGTPA